MTDKYEGRQRNDVSSTSTIDAIKNGERTATTRYGSNGHIDYWSQVQIGDVIEFHDNEGNSVKVVCTRPLNSLSAIFDPEQASSNDQI
jgi:hypothetical protein